MGAAAIAGLLPILYCSYTSIRFLLDVVPILALLPAVGTWIAYNSYRRTRIRRPVVETAIIGPTTASFVVSLCLAVSGAMSRFDDLNLQLCTFLLNLFSK